MATTTTTQPAIKQLTIALEDGTRVLAGLAADAHTHPCPTTLDAFLSQARGLLLIALRARRQMGGDPPAPMAPLGKAA